MKKELEEQLCSYYKNILIERLKEMVRIKLLTEEEKTCLIKNRAKNIKFYKSSVVIKKKEEGKNE